MEAQETGGGIDWDALPASVVAWVHVPGTTVDYPIVQGRPESPDFYLTHAPAAKDQRGALPTSRRVRAGAESPLVIVYGHHMSDGTMFAPLAQYSSRGFAEGHRTIRVYTRENAIELEVFAADVVDASSEGKRDQLRRRCGARRRTSGTNCPSARSSWKIRRTSRMPGPS